MTKTTSKEIPLAVFHIKKILKGAFQTSMMVTNLQGVWDLNREKIYYLIASLYLPLCKAQQCLSTFLLSDNTGSKVVRKMLRLDTEE